MNNHRSIERALGCVRSILIITKHNFIGDTIVATPMLRAVRSAFPDALVVVLTGTGAGDVLEACPFVDRTLIYDPRGAQRGIVGTAGVIREVRNVCDGAPDMSLIVDRSIRAAALAAFCGAPVRAGFDTEGRGWLLTHRVPYSNDRRETECCLDIVRCIAPEGCGEPEYNAEPILFVTEAERENGARLLREQRPVSYRGESGYVGIQPGANYRRKQWTTLGFADVARALAADGLIPVLLGGKAEIATAQAVRSELGPDVACIDLTGATSIRETMGVLTQVALFIGNDTGVSHMAASLGASTLQLFGPTSDEKWGQRSGHNLVRVAPGRVLERLDSAPVIGDARQLLSHHAIDVDHRRAGTSKSGAEVAVPVGAIR